MLNRFGSTALAALFVLGACAHEAEAPAAEFAAVPAAETETWSVRLNDTTIGQMVATTEGDSVKVDYEFRNNGRGPTMAEMITLGADGLPTAWTIDGATDLRQRGPRNLRPRRRHRQLDRHDRFGHRHADGTDALHPAERLAVLIGDLHQGAAR
jgi:hypothetical protein